MQKDVSFSFDNSQLEAWLPKHQHYPAGGLYLVATPIGNLADITLRALWVLHLADVILCEDTRVTRKLLSAYGISAQLLAYHEHNAQEMQAKVLEMVAAGKRIALVSDAGTPLISDPGYPLVCAMHAAGHYVTSIPGASSITLALTLAGLPTDRFLYLGFLPPKAKARQDETAKIATLPYTLVLLESPHRIVDCLQDLASAMGSREAALIRELTKRHEEVHKAPLTELATHYAKEGAPKGEIVLVIAPAEASATALDASTLEAALTEALKTESVKDASARLAELYGLSKKEVYALALRVRE